MSPGRPRCGHAHGLVRSSSSRGCAGSRRPGAACSARAGARAWARARRPTRRGAARQDRRSSRATRPRCAAAPRGSASARSIRPSAGSSAATGSPRRARAPSAPRPSIARTSGAMRSRKSSPRGRAAAPGRAAGRARLRPGLLPRAGGHRDRGLRAQLIADPDRQSRRQPRRGWHALRHLPRQRACAHLRRIVHGGAVLQPDRVSDGHRRLLQRPAVARFRAISATRTWSRRSGRRTRWRGCPACRGARAGR